MRLQKILIWSPALAVIMGFSVFSIWSWQTIQQLQEQTSTLRAKLASTSKKTDDLEQRLTEAEVDMLLLQEPKVDLTKTVFQPIGERFSVDITGVTRHLTGVKISGSILNHDSVTHEQAKFKVSVGRQSNEFIIPRLRSGYAAKFSVYVPDVDVKSARFAEFEWQESLLKYFSQ